MPSNVLPLRRKQTFLNIIWIFTEGDEIKSRLLLKIFSNLFTFLGEIVNTPDLVEGLKSGKIFGVALDVFEGEKAFMFKDMTKVGYEHYPELQELTSMHNVIISSHIAFYTDESVKQITEKTLSNFEGFIGKSEVDEKAFVA